MTLQLLETPLAEAEPSSSRKTSDSLVPLTIPTLNFDSVTKEKFMEMQRSDDTLAPLWERAKKGEKHLFIVDGLLMSMTSTLNSVSHALQQLNHKVLLAAHEGLGHGGLNTTKSLINRHFTWPNMASDIKSHVTSCKKCLKFIKSNGAKVPTVEPELISQRGEKLVVDIVGPLTLSKSKMRFILTCMELSSGFPFAIPLRTIHPKKLLKLFSQSFLYYWCPTPDFVRPRF